MAKRKKHKAAKRSRIPGPAGRVPGESKERLRVVRADEDSHTLVVTNDNLGPDGAPLGYVVLRQDLGSENEATSLGLIQFDDGAGDQVKGLRDVDLLAMVADRLARCTSPPAGALAAAEMALEVLGGKE